MAVKELNEIYGEVGRNLDKQMDENVLIPGETGTKTFGAFKFFSGIKKFLAGSAKKIINGGASVEGGLAVDSLTVNGSKPFINDFKSPALFSLDDANKGNAGITLVHTYNCQNLPPIDDWYALISSGDNNTSVQVAVPLFNNYFFKRVCASGNWSDWVSLVSDTGWKELASGISYRSKNGFLTLYVSTQFVPSMNTLKLPFTFLSDHATLLYGVSVVGRLIIHADGVLEFKEVAEGMYMFCDFTFPMD